TSHSRAPAILRSRCPSLHSSVTYVPGLFCYPGARSVPLRTPTTPPRGHGLHHRPPPHDGNLPRGARCLTSRGDAARSAPRGPLAAWRAVHRGVAPARNLTPDAVWGRSQTEESDGTDDPRAGWWGGEGHGARGRVEG